MRKSFTAALVLIERVLGCSKLNFLKVESNGLFALVNRGDPSLILLDNELLRQVNKGLIDTVSRLSARFDDRNILLFAHLLDLSVCHLRFSLCAGTIDLATVQ